MAREDESFALRFDALYASAYRISYRLLGDRAESQDVASEALARAYARWPRIAERPDPWVVRVASNLAIDAVRRQRTSRDKLPLLTHEAHTSLGTDARRIDLQRALLGLPTRQREVVVLRHICDLGEHDVAKTLGISVGSVKSHGARGLAALREALGER